jgi:hypothetical protein
MIKSRIVFLHHPRSCFDDYLKRVTLSFFAELSFLLWQNKQQNKMATSAKREKVNDNNKSKYNN